MTQPSDRQRPTWFIAFFWSGIMYITMYMITLGTVYYILNDNYLRMFSLVVSLSIGIITFFITKSRLDFQRRLNLVNK